jgi:hypothetical protein
MCGVFCFLSLRNKKSIYFLQGGGILLVEVLSAQFMIIMIVVVNFRYTPSQQGVAFNSGAKQRIIRMVEAQKDPMEPPKFK